MAKVPFTKLGLKVDTTISPLLWNEQNVEVKRYLPVEDKIKFVSEVVSLSMDDNNFINPIKVDVYFHMKTIEYYSNISFTEKQKENTTKTYDMICSSGLIREIIRRIPSDEYNDLLEAIHKTIKSIIKYKNSALGIFDALSQDHNAIDLDISNVMNKISDPEALSTLKQLAQLSGLVDTKEVDIIE